MHVTKKARTVTVAAATGMLALAVAGGAIFAKNASAQTPAAVTYNARGINVHPLVENEGQAGPNATFACQTRTTNRCYSPQQIRAAYGIQPLLDQGYTGKGRTIVIIDAYGSHTIEKDLATFDSLFGLNAPAFETVAPDGQVPYDPNDANQAGWSGETTLDVEWAHAVAPDAKIVLVVAKTNQDADILSATKYAVDHSLGDVFSQSFGEGETCVDSRLLRDEHAVFQAAAAKKITLLASSGDQGAAQPACDGSNSFFLSASSPASDPLVTGVGGTHLNADKTTGAWVDERAWQGLSGGGFSTLYRRPGYQAEIPGIASKTRGVPDVAYNGDTDGGVLTAWTCPPGEFPGLCDGNATFVFRFGGTSAGSPQWAGVTAIADQFAGKRLGLLNRSISRIAQGPSYASAFHDITVGDNTFTYTNDAGQHVTVQGYQAVTGWDAVTGWGTPVVNNLVPLLAANGDDDGQDAGN